MSNFAERLVARSAGMPPAPGIPVLAPRPVSRFEPIMVIDTETVSEPHAVHPATTPIAASGEAQIGPTAGQTAIDDRARPSDEVETTGSVPLGDINRTPGHESAVTSPALQINIVQTPPPDTGQTQYRRVATMPVAAEGVATRHRKPATDLTAVEPSTEISLRQHDAEATPVQPDRPSPNENIPPPSPFHEAHGVHEFNLERRAATSTSSAGTIGERPVEQAPAPVISIGKIEVQFLPQEPRMPAPRPQPQRTRGFDAYARARRGEPR